MALTKPFLGCNASAGDGLHSYLRVPAIKLLLLRVIHTAHVGIWGGRSNSPSRAGGCSIFHILNCGLIFPGLGSNFIEVSYSMIN